MMEKLTKLIMYALLAGVILSPFIANIYLIYNKNNFSCEAKTNTQREDVRYLARIVFHFKGGAGEFHMVGTYIGLDNVLRKVEWNAPFTYTRDETGITLLLSSESIKDNELAMLLKPVISDFYLFKDRELNIMLSPQGNEGYVFITDGIPVLLCVKVNT
ncbi:hypothetical protein [Serratia fonticola]|uniref:hypothetical protein n=1 Tax=Serratia fonticola TaxID=47917 RepID=UPI0016482F86|nr:hypothetical protein [Serratia fonticola]MBC3231822.1 hypothetical protein [Serratia fonticola]